MERDGLVVVEADRQLSLTAAGRHRALGVARKHRLAERLLADVIGLDWELVHEEACRWEHVMSEHVERRLFEMLGFPTESPYGNPIPDLESIGGKASSRFLDGVVRLTDWVSEQPRPAVLRRLAEPAQFDQDQLKQLHLSGLVPGAKIVASRDSAGSVEVTAQGGDALRIAEEVARHLYIQS